MRGLLNTHVTAWVGALAACGPFEASITRRSFLLGLSCFGFLFQFVISQGGLDGVFSQHGAVQFHRREAQLLGDVCVFDGQGFLHLRGRQDRWAVLVMLSGGTEEQTLLGWGEPGLQRHCLSQ